MGRQEEFSIIFKLKDMASNGLKAIRELLKSIKDIDYTSVISSLKSVSKSVDDQKKAELASVQKKNQDILDSSRRTFNEEIALGKKTVQDRVIQINEELKIETLSAAQRRRLEEELVEERSRSQKKTRLFQDSVQWTYWLRLSHTSSFIASFLVSVSHLST